MTKDTRDVKIEQQDTIIRCLAETAAKYKQELDLVKQERDSAVCDSILVKAQSDSISMTFNEPQYDLMELQLQLKESSRQISSFRKATQEFQKEILPIVKQLGKKMPGITRVHSFDNENITLNVKSVTDVVQIEELHSLLDLLTVIINAHCENIDESFKHEFIKGIDTKTFEHNEGNDKLARSAIISYARSVGLQKQFAENNILLDDALSHWFGKPFHESELKKMTFEKAKEYMRPHNRAERAVNYAVRNAKRKEHDFRQSK